MITIRSNPGKNRSYSDMYISWIYNLAMPEAIRRDDSYKKLVQALHSFKFEYSDKIALDQNRVIDGIDLRDRFIDHITQDEYHHLKVHPLFEGEPCSVLEMMVAMAIRCEETMMAVPELGNRTSRWFWEMIVNLELDDMNDYNFDAEYVASVVNRLITRNYSPDGKGGLFYIPNCPRDMRNEELWVQLCWYMGTKEQ